MAKPPSRGHVARVTVVLTMDDGTRAVYLLEGDEHSEVSVETKVNTRKAHGLLVREEAVSYDYTFELKNLPVSDVTVEHPVPAEVESSGHEITADTTGR